MLKRIWMPSPNYSSRGGTSVRLAVVHTAEGALTIESLAAYFQGNVGASSHTGADDKPGPVVGEMVSRSNKAWTQANANPYCVSIELCGFAGWGPSEWDKHPNMLANCAAWIAEECEHYGIPITRLSASQAQGGGTGVCGHSELGQAGGGHWDPGPDFPWDRTLNMARGGTPAQPDTPEPTGADEMVATAVTKDGRVLVVIEKQDGRVFRAYQKDDGSWALDDQGKVLWQPMGNPGK